MQGVAEGMTNWVSFAIGVRAGHRLGFHAPVAQDSRGVDRRCRGDHRRGRFQFGGGCRRLGRGTAAPGLALLPNPASFHWPISARGGGAIAITLVSFADMSVLSRTFALRGGYTVDQNQEMIALGAANVAAGFFQGFSISSSPREHPWRNRRVRRHN